MIDLILRPFRRRYGKDKAYYRALYKIFGLSPNNIELYKLALIHRSASLFLSDGTVINNERLEFLGDAILESIVSDYLFIEFPEENEGFLTQLRSKIVSRHMLDELAIQIGLDAYIIAHYGGNYTQKHLYGDALEAMIGAIYLDKGYDYVNRLFINDIFPLYIDLDDLNDTETDFKSRLIEWSQKRKLQLQFHTEFSDKHTVQTPHFRSKVVIKGEVAGEGEGCSKKEAEQHAARHAYAWSQQQDQTHQQEQQDPKSTNTDQGQDADNAHR